MNASRLTDAEVDARLASLPGWRREDNALKRRFDFPDYHHTLAFVNAVAWIAHADDHHPDLSVHYGHCEVRWSTHSAGGITARDILSAAKVDALIAGGTR
ncbi:MAG: 4a-hydroxytetrahydrobiopterin dehydratase [Burkholderiaceae bacterium]|nr:4a-hydroxytetrahydrobiopterin dehydratase [Rhodoferax sp.]MCP5285256.1 4a-hydroxytetrahydrobiopterin dehydratase [Burkholderiaceae bacterium]